MAKKQVYRLEAMLRLKLRQKHMAELALAKALNRLKEAKEKKEELVKEKEMIAEDWLAQRQEMRAKMDDGGVVFDGNVYLNFLRKLKEDEKKKEEEITEQENKIAKCEEKVARCRRDYIDAAKQHQIMEKHKELWEKKVEKELSREEAKVFDELANTIHQLKGWRGERQSGRDTMTR